MGCLKLTYEPEFCLSLAGDHKQTLGRRKKCTGTYKYKYNGKELQDELGLNMYSMDFRSYDPAIARWVVQDPVVHHNLSPYNAFDNNPIYWADPSGADSSSFIDELWNKSGDGETKWTNKSNGTFSSNTGQTADTGETEGSNSQEDPKGKAEKPINWFKKGVDESLWEVANNDNKALNGVLVLYTHGNTDFILGPNGEQIRTAEDLNKILIQYSSQWKTFVENGSRNGAKFTLVLKACNTGEKGAGSLAGTVTNMNFAKGLTYDIKGLTVIAPSGMYRTASFFGINFEVGVSNPNGKDTWNAYYNNTLIKRFND